MIRLTKEVSLHKDVEAFELTPDICLAHLVITENETIICDTYIFCKSDKVDKLLDNINYKEDIFFRNLKFLHKDFIEDYKYSATPYKLEYFIDKYGINRELLWRALTSEDFDIHNYRAVEICYDNNTIYPFIYGETKYGWYPHMVAYSMACYMLTDLEYDLPSVKEFLLEQESKNLIHIKKKDSIYCSYEEDVIQNVPYYNIDTAGNKYINFYCLVSSAEEYNAIREDFITHTNPLWRTKLERFKTRREES